jgi:flagellar protein FliL
MAAAEEKAEAPIAAPAPSGGNRLLLLLTVTNMVVVGAMFVVLLLSFQRDRKKPGVEDIVASAGEHEAGKGEGKEGEKGGKARPIMSTKMLTLEQFTVNLSTPGAATPKYVRVNISLEVPTEDTENEVNSKMPQVRNVIIDLFNSKRPSDLATAEGRDYLKEEIRNALNAFMVNGKVKGVFFTNFALTS